MPNTNWGILATGNIAHRFATDLANLPDANLVAVGSRALERAQAFADQYRIPQAYGSYEELAQAPDVDAIYVATPHPFHKDNAILCMEAGKAVLCEKPMAINADQVQAMIDAARANDVFLMEAMWTRFLPVIRQVKDWLDEGRIGNVRLVSADFGFRAELDPSGRLFDPALGGGALLDVGVYTIAFAYLTYGGQSPTRIQALSHLGKTGVDEQTGMVLGYADGALAQLTCAVRTRTPQSARIDGTEGRVQLPDFWHATTATLEVPDQEPVQIEGESGYHFEAQAVMDCLEAGLKESELMPLDESLAIAQTMDQVRELIGLQYPMENK
jgi:predicted dehydrogenase